MKVSRLLFVSSAVFSAGLGIAYWIVAREAAGTTLLAFMTVALSMIAGYMFFAERDARLLGDRKGATTADAAGENVGTYITHSPIPFWIGLTIAFMGVGLTITPVALGFGVIILLFLGALLIVRSR